MRWFWARDAGRADILAPGLYAWGVTVAWPAAQRFAPLGARIAALLALVALVVGAVLISSSPLVARISAIWLFLGASVVSWAFLGPELSSVRFDPAQGVLGAVGFTFFAMSFGAPRETSSSAARSTPIQQPPRQAISPSLPAIVGLVGTGASLLLVVAWSVSSPERALFAHAVTLAMAVALVTVAADIFDPRGRLSAARGGRPPSKDRLAQALPAMVTLMLLLLVGVSYVTLR